MNFFKSLLLVFFGIGVGLIISAKIKVTPLVPSEAGNLNASCAESETWSPKQPDFQCSLKTLGTSVADGRTAIESDISKAVGSDLNSMRNSFDEALKDGDFTKASQALAQISKTAPNSKRSRKCS